MVKLPLPHWHPPGEGKGVMSVKIAFLGDGCDVGPLKPRNFSCDELRVVRLRPHHVHAAFIFQVAPIFQSSSRLPQGIERRQQSKHRIVESSLQDRYSVIVLFLRSKMEVSWNCDPVVNIIIVQTF